MKFFDFTKPKVLSLCHLKSTFGSCPKPDECHLIVTSASPSSIFVLTSHIWSSSLMFSIQSLCMHFHFPQLSTCLNHLIVFSLFTNSIHHLCIKIFSLCSLKVRNCISHMHKIKRQDYIAICKFLHKTDK